MNEAVIIPTGNEIKDGTVLDTNSSAIMFSIISMAPLCTVHRVKPVEDNQNEIYRAVEYWVNKGVDLVVVIGGSGGGHLYSSSLSKDYTHNALESLLDEKTSREIWGKNGHLWSKLVCGKKNGVLVINVPGPYTEAKAAIEAFCRIYSLFPNGLAEINTAMIQAVFAQYPKNEIQE